jgi:glycosyltransferase involved in cell wall biosynthesis
MSLVIPTWNAARTIGAALDSALGQSVPPDEVIVVDDGSTDETKQVLGAYAERVVYIEQKNAGPAAARNRGLQVAQGNLICFLDADDLFAPDALALLARTLEANPSSEIAHGQVQDFRERDGESVFHAPRFGPNLGSAVFRRSVFEKIGNFEESLRLAEDLDFWLRTREHGITRQLVPAVTYWYRRRPAEPPGYGEVHKAVLVHLVKRSLERTRQLGQ